MRHEIAEKEKTCPAIAYILHNKHTTKDTKQVEERAYHRDDVEGHGPVGYGRQYNETGRGLDATALC